MRPPPFVCFPNLTQAAHTFRRDAFVRISLSHFAPPPSPPFVLCVTCLFQCVDQCYFFGGGREDCIFFVPKSSSHVFSRASHVLDLFRCFSFSNPAQVATWLLYYRNALHGVSIEELKQRKAERAAAEERELAERGGAEVPGVSRATGTTKQSVI